MQPTVSDHPPASAHHRNLSAPQTSADSRDFLEDGPSISYVLPATSLMRTRMDVHPFNPDSEAWNTWFAHFQEATSNNGWSPADRCEHLQALVQGKARLALTAIPREQRTYTECVERLRASYAPRKRPDEWIAELRDRRQATAESFMQYRDTLCTLALRVHGGDPNSASWLIAQFCDGLRDQDIGQRLAERDSPPPPYSLRLRRHHTSSASLTDVGFMIGWLAMSVSHPRSRMTHPPHGRTEFGWISTGIAPWRVAAIYRVGPPPGQHTSPTPPS